MDKNVAVIYHKNCTDGLGAAWVANKYFSSKGLSVEFIAADFKDPFPEHLPKGMKVYIMDFSYFPEVIEKVMDKYELIMLDHHDTAMRKLEHLAPKFPHVFDQNRSGTGIAWDFFFPTTDRPRIINLIEDQDLWKMKYPETVGFTCYLNMDLNFYKPLDQQFHLLESISWMLESGKEKQEEFRLLSRYYMNQVDILAKPAMMVSFEDYIFPVVNAPSIFSSHIGNKLAQTHGLAAIYSIKQDMSITYSLRSIPPYNVALLAEKYNGGGHPYASGLKIMMGENKEYPFLPPGWRPVNV